MAKSGGKEAARKPLEEKDILCLGHLKRVFKLLDALKDVGTERDTAGNRELFFNDYCKLVLLYVWNPLIGSLRGLQQAAELENVAKALNVKRFALSSFSEAPRVFDAEQLKPIVQELARQVAPVCDDPRLKELKHAITLVDGTVLTGLSRLVRCAVGAEGRYTTARDGRGVYGWRLHTQLELKTFTPHRIDRTGARNAGTQREHNVLRQTLEAGRCYVDDNGYADRTLFDAIVEADSSYVTRLRENSVMQVIEERLLSQEALDAGVVRDALVSLGDEDAQTMNHPVRIVEMAVQPHPRRTRNGSKQSERIPVATCLLELPAELIALIYHYRYTIELFFRIFKQLLGMRHLLSQKPEGLDIQIHCTCIVCLLLCLMTGKKPTKANRNMIGWYLIGMASQEELIRHLNKPDRTGTKLKAKDELWKKMGY